MVAAELLKLVSKGPKAKSATPDNTHLPKSADDLFAQLVSQMGVELEKKSVPAPKNAPSVPVSSKSAPIVAAPKTQKVIGTIYLDPVETRTNGAIAKEKLAQLLSRAAGEGEFKEAALEGSLSKLLQLADQKGLAVSAVKIVREEGSEPGFKVLLDYQKPEVQSGAAVDTTIDLSAQDESLELPISTDTGDLLPEEEPKSLVSSVKTQVETPKKAVAIEMPVPVSDQEPIAQEIVVETDPKNKPEPPKPVSPTVQTTLVDKKTVVTVAAGATAQTHRDEPVSPIIKNAAPKDELDRSKNRTPPAELKPQIPVAPTETKPSTPTPARPATSALALAVGSVHAGAAKTKTPQKPVVETKEPIATKTAEKNPEPKTVLANGPKKPVEKPQNEPVSAPKIETPKTQKNETVAPKEPELPVKTAQPIIIDKKEATPVAANRPAPKNESPAPEKQPPTIVSQPTKTPAEPEPKNEPVLPRETPVLKTTQTESVPPLPITQPMPEETAQPLARSTLPPIETTPIVKEPAPISRGSQSPALQNALNLLLGQTKGAAQPKTAPIGATENGAEPRKTAQTTTAPINLTETESDAAVDLRARVLMQGWQSPQPGIQTTPQIAATTPGAPAATHEQPSFETAPAEIESENAPIETASLTERLQAKVRSARATVGHFATRLKEVIENYKPPVMQISLTLNPASLGSVDVILKSRGNNLQISVQSNPQALALFYQNSAEFRQNLQQMGFEGVALSFGQQQQNDSQQGGKNPYSYTAAADTKGSEVAFEPQTMTVEIPLYG